MPFNGKLATGFAIGAGLQLHIGVADVQASWMNQETPLKYAPNVFVGTSSSALGPDGAVMSINSTTYSARFSAPGPAQAAIMNFGAIVSGTSALVTMSGTGAY